MHVRFRDANVLLVGMAIPYRPACNKPPQERRNISDGKEIEALAICKLRTAAGAN
jgi:hypothetical protein